MVASHPIALGLKCIFNPILLSCKLNSYWAEVDHPSHSEMSLFCYMVVFIFYASIGNKNVLSLMVQKL